jgi:hypothetical protein
LDVFNLKTQIIQNEYKLISYALGGLEMLTPITKNIQINNSPLTDGILLRIDNQLNKESPNYLEITISQNNIISKLGESLQAIVIQGLSSNFDITTSEVKRRYYYFEFNKIRGNRLIKNAFVNQYFIDPFISIRPKTKGFCYQIIIRHRWLFRS